MLNGRIRKMIQGFTQGVCTVCGESRSHNGTESLDAVSQFIVHRQIQKAFGCFMLIRIYTHIYLVQYNSQCNHTSGSRKGISANIACIRLIS